MKGREQLPRPYALVGAVRQKSLPLTASGPSLQDIGRTAHAGPCGMAANMPRLRRSTRERRPTWKAVAASTPAGVDGRRGETPSKKRCVESQLPLGLR